MAHLTEPLLRWDGFQPRSQGISAEVDMEESDMRVAGAEVAT